MGFLSRLFGRPPAEPAPPEHAVLVKLRLSDDAFGSVEERESIHELSATLEQRLEESGAGELDGDEFGDGGCTLFLYGPDADRLFTAIEPALRASAHGEGAAVIKRYGPADDLEARMESFEL